MGRLNGRTALPSEEATSTGQVIAFGVGVAVRAGCCARRYDERGGGGLEPLMWAYCIIIGGSQVQGDFRVHWLAFPKCALFA
jgi:hypothetical protein